MNIEDRICDKLGEGFTCELIGQRPGEEGGVIVSFLVIDPGGRKCWWTSFRRTKPHAICGWVTWPT
jgi:hypothetical protein